jgi:hypothetical protein
MLWFFDEFWPEGSLSSHETVKNRQQGKGACRCDEMMTIEEL